MRSMCRVLIKKTSSVYYENSQFACPGRANCFGTSSVSLVQRQRRCDGRTYRAETVEQRVDGGWRNEDAVVQQLGTTTPASPFSPPSPSLRPSTSPFCPSLPLPFLSLPVPLPSKSSMSPEIVWWQRLFFCADINK